MGESSARAYFDYPVLAWLAHPIDGSVLAGLASRLDMPFELTTLGMTGTDVFLRLGPDTARAMAGLASRVPLASDATEWLPGPFPAGIGVYCATLAPTLTLPDSITAALDGQTIRAKTYMLAQIELCWGPDLSLQSSWATLSSARSRVHRR